MGSVAGSALQFAVQLPVVLRVAPDLRSPIDVSSQTCGRSFARFVPVFVSRGVVQVSAYIDTLLASLLPTGAVAGAHERAAALHAADQPVRHVGLGRRTAGDVRRGQSRSRRRRGASRAPRRGLRRIAFFVVPSAMAFLALGDVVAAALLQTGRFRHADAVYVWGILAGSAVGLLASTLGRLYSSTYYALRDTRTPLNYALIRVALTTVFGYPFFALPLPRRLSVSIPRWGAAGLTASAGIAGWIEMLMLRRTMNARIGKTGLPASYVVTLPGSSAAAGAAVAWGIKLALPAMHPDHVAAALVLGPYGLSCKLGATTVISGLRRQLPG